MTHNLQGPKAKASVEDQLCAGLSPSPTWELASMLLANKP
jgi:hypothetical protein